MQIYVYSFLNLFQNQSLVARNDSLLCNAAFTSDEPPASYNVYGDWIDGPLLDTRVYEGFEQLSVAGHCLHHPGYPH